MKLYIGNKNYSSWSMRPWVLLTQFGIDFEEVVLRFDSFDDSSQFKKTLRTLAPVSKVPLLIDADFVVWDTLAISEYLAEKFPDKNLWPADVHARARARSICAEMHAGFSSLRSACPLNIEAKLSHIGALLLRDNAGLCSDLLRLDSMWSALLAQHKCTYLFGDFSIADAYFAPVVMRLITYGLPVSACVSDYVLAMQSNASVQAWVNGALAEQDFLTFEEPYRLTR